MEAIDQVIEEFKDTKTYLVLFKQKMEYQSFCYAELESLAEMFGVEP